MTDYEIREMQILDHPDVIRLWKSVPGIGLSDADSKAGIAMFLTHNPGLSYVACNGGELVAAVLCGNDGRRGYIHHLAVHPEHRKRGLGKRLVERCLTVLRNCGIQKCHLFVYRENLEGMAFWEHTGWIERIDLTIMSKEIV